MMTRPTTYRPKQRLTAAMALVLSAGLVLSSPALARDDIRDRIDKVEREQRQKSQQEGELDEQVEELHDLADDADDRTPS